LTGIDHGLFQLEAGKDPITVEQCKRIASVPIPVRLLLGLTDEKRRILGYGAQLVEEIGSQGC
jgi:hypothetical protein